MSIICKDNLVGIKSNASLIEFKPCFIIVVQKIYVKASSHVKELKHENWNLSLGLFVKFDVLGPW